ncbi:MAG: TIGR03668 family PPOX class F420-dependent oxidoreductase [Chloroflexota bacterium]|nr:TIGR03668 family PPOX class F420-dependent oxidoreductase [Chloroflexota bacterium]
MRVEDARGRFEQARVARLATVRPDGQPHIVPIVFALEDDLLYSIVDAKPKRGPDLVRLRNIAAEPRVSLLVDQYEEDWQALWWVRADGVATVVESGPPRDVAIRLLLEKYRQYDEWATPLGAAVVVRIERWSSWSFT